MRASLKAFLGLAIFASCFPAFAGPRAFVSSTGSDANVATGCTLAAPCRGFQAAHTAVDPGGEIVALDTAGYGIVTISKSVTIMANPGVVAGITDGGVTTDAVTIATPGVRVILRGLNINNIGDPPNRGIFMSAGDALNIENCVISRFGAGVFINAAAKVKVVDSLMRGNGTGMYATGGATVDVTGSRFIGTNNTGFGFTVQGAAGSTTSASISDSVASDNFSGFVANATPSGANVRFSCIRCTSSNNVQIGFLNASGTGATARTLVSGSMASYNGQYGFLNSGDGAVFTSLGNNALHENTSGATSGTITVVAGN